MANLKTFADLNKLNIDSLADVISLTLGAGHELQSSITTLNGIPNGTPIVNFNAGQGVIEAANSCGDNTGAETFESAVKYFDHAPLQVPVVICLQDIWGKMLAKGVRFSDDFAETELAGFIQAELTKAMEADMLAMAWLGGNQTEEGSATLSLLKQGGILKQYVDAGETLSTITMTPEGVLETMRNLIDAQDPARLDSSEFFVTTNVLRQYKNLLQNTNNHNGQIEIQDGKPQYYFEGYKINDMKVVSGWLPQTKVTAICAFSPRENLQLAFESSEMPIAPFIQDAKSRKYYSTTQFAADVKIAATEFAKIAANVTA